MTTIVKRLTAAAIAAAVLAACKDVPLLPQWDASWNVPLPSDSLVLPQGTVPNGLSAPVSFPAPRQEALDKTVGSLLQNAADTGTVLLTLIKKPSLALTGNLTLKIDSTPAFGASTISFPVSFTAASDTTKISSSTNALGMVRATANNNGSLYIQLTGTASNPGPGSVTITAANDTIYVKLALVSTIHVSQ